MERTLLQNCAPVDLLSAIEPVFLLRRVRTAFSLRPTLAAIFLLVLPSPWSAIMRPISVSVICLPRGIVLLRVGLSNDARMRKLSGLRNAPNYYPNRSAIVFYYELYHGASIVLGQSKPTDFEFC